MTKSVCFDVIGTCFTFDHPITTIQKRLAPILTPAHVDPKTLFFAWFYAAQRDFTYVSLCDSYTPIAQVLKQTFRRACAIVDVDVSKISDEDVDEIMKAFRSMGPRPGLKRAIDVLREGGWDVYGVTNGGVEVSLGYFHAAGIELDADHLLSCDNLKIAKPDVRVYNAANEHLTTRGLGNGDGNRWFVAAHAWDLTAARVAGFKTAYLGFEEHDAVPRVFGEFDLVAESMEELLENMTAL